MFNNFHLNSSASTSDVNVSMSNEAMNPEGNLFSFPCFCANIL